MKYTTESIIQSIQSEKKQDFLFFWGHQASKHNVITKSCLSQWWPSTFESEEKIYHTAEHYMMAQKARLFNDHDIMEIIISSSNPKEVKSLGRKVKNFDQEKWDSSKFEIVLKGNHLKFSQDSALSEYLKSTAPSIIVEASPVDKIWGVGMAEDNPDIHFPSKWRGHNLLGFALMEVRDQLIN